MSSLENDQTSEATETETTAGSAPFVSYSYARKIVLGGVLVLLVGFFVFPWIKTTATYGDHAYELAAYASILWLIPLGALLLAGIVFVMNEANPKLWFYWLVVLLVALTLLCIYAWVSGIFIGNIYVPWAGNQELEIELARKYHSIVSLGPTHFLFYVSPLACVILILSSLGSILKRRINGR